MFQNVGSGSAIVLITIRNTEPEPNLIIFGVAASCEEVYEKEDEGEYQPGGGHAADNAQALQVQLGLRSKPVNTLLLLSIQYISTHIGTW